jgi:hypothetical protein
MKKMLLYPVLLLSVFCGCTTTYPTASPEESYRLRVELRNDLNVRQTVLFLIRQGRARDIKEDVNFDVRVIEAAYYSADTPIGVLRRIADDLQQTAMVMEVHLEENHSVIRQSIP